MLEPLFTKKLAATEIPLRFTKFRQSLLRVGLPIAALATCIDYAAFRISASGSGRSYPWLPSLLFAVPAALAMAAVWWLLMREIAAWKLRNRQ